MKFLKRQKKVHKANLGHKPEIGQQALRDWEFALIGFVILVLLLVLLDVYLLFKIGRGTLFSASPETSVNTETLDRKTLLDANRFFESRQKEYEMFITGTSTDIDPSV